MKKDRKNTYEITGEISDLIEQAEYALKYTQEDSVGYYYYWMLEALKKLNGDNKIVEFRSKTHLTDMVKDIITDK